MEKKSNTLLEQKKTFQHIIFKLHIISLPFNHPRPLPWHPAEVPLGADVWTGPEDDEQVLLLSHLQESADI